MTKIVLKFNKTYFMKTKLLLMLLFLSISIQAQTNLVPNGNFENWTSSSQPNNWFRFFNGLVFQSTSAQNGSSSTKMQITSGTFNYINSEFFPVVAGKTYRITMYHKLVTGTFSAIELSLYHKPSTFKSEITKKTDAVTSSTEWRKIEFDYTPTVSESIEVDIWTRGTLDSEILVDNVSVIDVATLGPQYTLIPDLNFEKKLIALGHDSGTPDGKVLTSNIASVTSLSVSSSAIADLTGIQDFVALNSLTCFSNQIQVLDLSKNPALSMISCSNNNIQSINLSNQSNLITLYLRYNNLKNLDISNCKKIVTLDCSMNSELTALNLSNNKSLQQLELIACPLTSLDLSQNNELTLVDCTANSITNLILPVSSTLKTLRCPQNKLTSIDVTKNPNLLTLVCSFNQLPSLDVTNNKLIQLLYCHANKLKTLDVSQNTVLTSLFCHNNLLESLNLKNANNPLITGSKILLNLNPNLTCIQVDSKTYADANWSSAKDAAASFAESCGNLSTSDIIFEKLNMYPNPTKGELYFDNVDIDKIAVYNALGKLMKVPFTSTGNRSTTNLEQLPAGIYYIYLTSDTATTVKKVIVN
jgi:Leucine-rich repeat (LRR) protein